MAIITIVDKYDVSVLGIVLDVFDVSIAPRYFCS